MKRRKEKRHCGNRKTHADNNRARSTNSDQVTEMLKACLQKVCELQSDLQRNEDQDDDPEVAGYAACAVETLRFLAQEGLPADHPVVSNLTRRLFRDDRV